MVLNVVAKSTSFKQYIATTVGGEINQQSEFSTLVKNNELYLIHASSMGASYAQWVKKHAKSHAAFIICADKPTLVDMLAAVGLGAKAYCNSYMQKEHYQQLIRLVSEGQSWFPPQMLAETFKLAEQSIGQTSTDKLLAELTSKEKEISLSVGKGYSNKQIAEALNITESTVKTHLTNIFKKLSIKDRVGLVLHMSAKQ